MKEVASSVRRPRWPAQLRDYGVASLASVALLLGCTVTSSVVPAVYASGASPDGDYTATSYVIEGGPGHAGEARLWSRGAFRDETDGGPRTLVHVGFSLTNPNEEPLRFDETRLRLIDVIGRTSNPYSVPAHRVEGAAPVARGESRQIDAYFALPASTWPDDVRSFGVEWGLDGDSARVQRTAFVSTSHLRRPYVTYRNGHYWPHGASPPGYVGPYSHPAPPHPYGWDSSRRQYADAAGPQRIYIRPRQP